MTMLARFVRNLCGCLLSCVAAAAYPTVVSAQAPAPTELRTPMAEQATAPLESRVVDPAAQLLQRLSTDNKRAVADMLAEDWKDRPEWVEMTIAVLRGQAMQPGAGWWRASDKQFGWASLKRKLDTNNDNTVDSAELPKELEDKLREKYFARLDVNGDDLITAADFDTSAASGMNLGAMKTRMTEVLFQHLDTDTNGQVTSDELLAFFKAADREAGQFLTTEDLLAAFEGDTPRRRDPATNAPPIGEQLKRFFHGELGWFESGPNVGDAAPDFTLPRHDQTGTVKLSESRDRQKPVVLILGSFT